MSPHVHTDFTQIVVTAVGVLVVFHVLRLSGIWLAKQDNEFAQQSGSVIGALLTFSK